MVLKLVISCVASGIRFHAIEVVCPDVVEDGAREQAVRAKVPRQGLAQMGGRQASQVVACLPGVRLGGKARNHQRRGKEFDLIPILPLGRLGEDVGSDHEPPLMAWALCLECAEGINGVGGSFAAGFHVEHLDLAFEPPDGKAAHGKAMGEICPGLFAEWMARARNQHDPLHLGGFQGPETRQHMADVGRIKGSAENPIDHKRFQIDILVCSRPQVGSVGGNDWRESISVSEPLQERAFIAMGKIAIQMYRWSEDWATFLDEIRPLGFFQGVELFASVAAEFAQWRSEWMETLKRDELRLAGVYGGGPLHHAELAGGVRRDLRNALGFLRDCGGDVLIFGPSPRPRDRHLHRDDFRRLADELEALGEEARKNHLRLAVHPRLGSVVESETELNLLLGMTSPEHVGLAFDPAHVAAARMDPLELLDIHADRIAYFHLKDLLPPKEPGRTGGEGRGDGLADEPFFTGLGEGFLDIPAMLRWIKTSAYPGWLTLEVGQSTESPLEKIRRGIAYLGKHL